MTRPDERRAAAGRRPERVLVSGGGTAGHVLPGLAIARELVRRGVPSSSIHFVGSERGVEVDAVPGAGFPLTVLPGRGIARRLTLDNVGAVWGLLRAVVRAARVVRGTHPSVVLALGGYASVPCVLWAWIFRVPIVVAEQNAVPGLANRLSARVARACAVSFPDTPLPRARWTGNPVRPEIVAVDRVAGRQAARDRLGVSGDRLLVAVFGGSLGARRINESVVGAVVRWRHRSDLAIRHVIGERDWELVTTALDRTGDEDGTDQDGGDGDEGWRLSYQPVRYEHDMATLYTAADVVCCRSGATTVAELAVVGVPAVLVPLPGAPGDHQTANARALVDTGAAVLVPDGELDTNRLVTEVETLLADPGHRAMMADAARRLARPDAAAAVADLIEEHARG